MFYVSNICLEEQTLHIPRASAMTNRNGQPSAPTEEQIQIGVKEAPAEKGADLSGPAEEQPSNGLKAEARQETRELTEVELVRTAINETTDQSIAATACQQTSPPDEATISQFAKCGEAGDGDQDERRKSKEQVAEKVGWMRHIVALLALSSIILANTNRQAFNQALVEMIRKKPSGDLAAAPDSTRPTDQLVDMTNQTVASTSTMNIEEATLPIQQQEDDDDCFDWTGQQKSLLQSAFSYGYMPLMIAGGRLSEIYGAKWVVFLSGFGSAVCSILTPLLADHSFPLLVASRVLMGISQTGVSPALYALLTRWLPPEESSVYLPMIKTGVMFGFMAGSLVNSFLSWRMTFYMVGLVGLLWSVMWTICVSSTPQQHRFISKREQQYLARVLVTCPASPPQKETTTKPVEADSAPWLAIITNPVVLAFMFTKLTVKLSTDAQTMQLPMYLNNVFHVSKQLNGYLNAINFAIQAICTGFVAYLIKEMITNSSFGLSKTGIRRLSQGINNFGMALGYVLMTFNTDSLGLAAGAVVLLALCSIFGAGGEAVLPIDLTNKYSASIMAIANTVANLSGIILPPIVSWLLANDQTDPMHWNYVWWFVAAFMTSGGFAFCFFVEAKVQDFDEQEPNGRKTLWNKKRPVLCDNCKQIIPLTELEQQSGKGQQVTVIEMKPR